MKDQKKVWDELSEQWYHFRQKPFRDISKILNKTSSMKKGKILDVGCGNCRNLLLFAKKNFNCYGIDFSKEMLKYGKKFCDKNKIKVNLKYGLAEKIPYNKNSFDYVLSIAVLHHLNTKEKREKSLKEIYRVLKKNGVSLITVWNKFPISLVIKERYIKWRKKGNVYKRYYYFYTFWELKKLLKKVGFKMLDSGIGRNIWFLVKK